jgi:hypothetical protein
MWKGIGNRISYRQARRKSLAQVGSRILHAFRVSRHFALKGPIYHFHYLSWHARRLWQILVPPDYAVETKPNEPMSVQYLRARPLPCFLFNTEDIPTIVERVPIELRKKTIAEAERLCQREFSFRNIPPVVFEHEIDWNYEAEGNTDWRWDLNRHGYFQTLGYAYNYTGNHKYADSFSEILNDWLDANPPDIRGRNWSSSFEVAFRINAWILAFFLFRHSKQLNELSLQRLIDGILTHCRFLNQNLEHHVRNNHLLLESKSLLLAAIMFPEFDEAPKWQQRASKILFSF